MLLLLNFYPTFSSSIEPSMIVSMYWHFYTVRLELLLIQPVYGAVSNNVLKIHYTTLISSLFVCPLFSYFFPYINLLTFDNAHYIEVNVILGTNFGASFFLVVVVFFLCVPLSFS